MAKGFPYFKFIATEWLTGDIVFEDYELQGIFINVCAIYWHRNGDVSILELKNRLKTDRLNSLSDRFILIDKNGKVSIKFLDEQLIEAGHISKVNSQNGKLGGRPKGAKTLEEKPTAKRPLSDRKAKKSKEEEELELKEELEKEINKSIEDQKNDFLSSEQKVSLVLDTADEKEKKVAPKKRKDQTDEFRTFFIQLGYDSELIDELLIFRKSKRLINTLNSAQLIHEDIMLTGYDVNTILKLIIKRQWASFDIKWDWRKYLEENFNNQNNKNYGTNQNTIRNPFRRENGGFGF